MQFRLNTTFLKEYKKLPVNLQSKTDERLKLFEDDQFAFVLDNHKLHGKFSDCRSINITGDYRAIYYVEENIAIFIHIGTHHQLYGK